jgi:hypothetical protein
MAKVSPIQSNFNGGEISPLLYGRPDIDKYKTGLQICLNFIPLVQGPIERRPGTVFLKEVKTSSASTRIISFEFSTTQAYIIELGNLYARFYKDNGAILSSTSTITGATQANPCVITDTAHPYANGDEVFITGVAGMTELNDKYYLVANQATDSYELTDIGGTNINSTGFTAYTSGGTAAEVIQLTTTYATADLFQLKFTQSADVLYITHPSYPPRKLTRTSDTAWTISDITFVDGPFLNTNVETTTLTLSTTTGSVTVTASAVTGINGGDGFQTTDVGRQIRWKDPDGNWTYLTITARASTTSVTATIDGPDASAGTATTSWRLGVWSETTGFPSAVTFHQDRLVFGGGVDTPQRVDMSRTGDFENFAPTEADGTVVDDNGVTVTLAADNVNAIYWMADDEKGLLVGTVGGEWTVRPSDAGGVITPSNVQAKRSSGFGSANVQPERVGRALLFLQRAKRKLRELAYAFEDDGFRAPDMTLVAEHVTRTGVVELAYQAEPQSILWCVITDGTLVGLTYEREQSVIGWHRHVLGGYSDSGDTTHAKVESVAVIPNAAGSASELYMVVNRYINGGTVRYIEYLKPFWDADNDQADAFFVDSGLTYSGASATTLTGLDHLEGEVVSVLSEGATHPVRTVASGAITLNAATTKAHVGLAYTSDAKTLRPDAGAKDGTAQGKLVRIHRVITRFFQSLGGKMGPDENSLDVLHFREGGDAMDTATPLFTGDVEVEWDGAYSSDAHIFIRQDQPLPMTLQALMPQMDTQDR